MKVSIIPWIVKKLKLGLALVEDGDTASQNIASGKYVSWKGNMCTASSAISSGDALSSSNLTAVEGGALNALNAHLENLILTKTISGTTDNDGMISLGLSTNNYVPVAFVPTVSVTPTAMYQFSVYDRSLYLTFLNKSNAIYKSLAISGILYYMER